MTNKISKKVQEFNDFRFAGLNWKQQTNKYITMNRVSEDGTKVVVKVADSHIFKSKFGYGLILDRTHVVWLKDWQVSDNYYGIEILLDSKYWTPKEWGEHEDFDDEPENLLFSTWADTAAEQDAHTEVDKYGDEVHTTRVKWEI
jgi:hypothetical protein